MSDLIAFLNARLDEDEAALRAIQDNSEPWRGEWAGDDMNFGLRTRNGWSLARAVTVEAGFPPGVLAHIVRHDPARVLREVEAKRAIVALHRPTEPDSEYGFTYPEAAKFCGYDGPGDNWQAEQEPDYYPDALWPCRTMRLLAAVYCDHPEYRKEWTP